MTTPQPAVEGLPLSPPRAANAERIYDVGEQQFLTVFEHAPIGMSLLDPQMRRLRVNRAFCQMLGHSEHDLLQRTLHAVTHPDDVAEDLRQRAALLSGERDRYQREKRFLHKDGHIVWGHVTCSLVRDAQGRPQYFIAQVQDATEGRQAEAALHDSEERFRSLSAMLHMAAQVGRLGAWSWDVGHEHIYWSEEVCAIHDLRPGFMPTPEQAIGFFAPAYQEAMRTIAKACVRDGSPFDVEAQIVTNRGRRRWVRLICEAEWDERGRVRRIQGACQDISDFKRVAEQNRAMAEQLTGTLESLTDAFFTVDRSLRFTYLNGEAERLLNRTRAQLLGRALGEALPELRDSDVEQHLQRALLDDAVMQYESEYAPLHLWVHVKIYPSPQGLAVYVRDVTDRIRAQQEILRLNAQLEERVRRRTEQLEAVNKELEAFSYSIAHDLRAPLSSIDGFSQILEQSAGEALPDRCRHFVARIRAGVRQMGDMTDGLLSLANYSRASLRSEPVDLARLAQAALAACREREPARSVEAIVAPRIPAAGDPRLLSQVMSNLVGNAWKFTARETQARIEVGIESGSDGRAVYFVKDNGAGFDMNHAARIFEAFQRMHSRGEFEGTGIGLAIVHKIVARHGGRIWAESAPGQGATFRFTLGDA